MWLLVLIAMTGCGGGVEEANPPANVPPYKAPTDAGKAPQKDRKAKAL